MWDRTKSVFLRPLRWWTRRSLRRWAWVDRALRSKLPRPKQAARAAAQISRRFTMNMGAQILVMLGLGIGLPSIELPFELPWIAGIADPAEFLRALWQVVGATLALSFAVIAFALEPLRQDDPASLKELVEESGMQWLLLLGVGALFAIGAALTSGSTQPSVSATTWALGLSALAIASIPRLFRSSLRAIQPEALHGRRILRIRRLGALEVREDLLHRLAFIHLKEFAESRGLHFSPLRSRPPGTGFKPIRAGRDGQILDIRLWRIRRLSKRLGAGNLYLVVRIGDYVRVTSEVLWVQSSANASERNVRRVFKIG